MKKLLFGSTLLAFILIFPLSAKAEVYVNIGIPLPPPIIFNAPPEVVVLPETNNVYVVPNVDVDMFFWNGWWWRPWQGGWYRSRYYNRGWVYFNHVPGFYYDVDPRWRGYYRDHNWHGRPWHYDRIPDRELQRNWRGWQRDRYWERQRSWGVRGYRPRTQQQMREMRYQREREYQRRPEVRRHEQMYRQQRQPQRQPQGQRFQREQQRHPQEQRYQREQQRQPQGQRYQRQPQRQPQNRGQQRKQERENRERP